MGNELKKVKDVFKDYETKGNILECEIVNVNIYKKTSKIAIDLKSSNKIQIGEKLAFEFYLKSKFRVEEAEINIDLYEEKNTKKTKNQNNDGEKYEEVTPIIIGSKRVKITSKPMKIKDIEMDSGKVVICRKDYKTRTKRIKNR